MSRVAGLAIVLLGAAAPVWPHTVNWTVSVTAHETYRVQSIQSVSKSATFSGQGGVQGVTPPSGTVSVGVTVNFPGRTGCYPASVSFPNVPHTGGYYSVWYAYQGAELHIIQLYRGNAGGELLATQYDYSYCPNGQKSMTAYFDWLVMETKTAVRSASASGTLLGGDGVTVSASWSAVPVAEAGGTLDQHVPSLSFDNWGVGMVLYPDPSLTSGLVTATFPGGMCDGTNTCGVGACANTTPKCDANHFPLSCAPLPAGTESCDSIDNDCDGGVDEDLGTSACGVGVCGHEVQNCTYGHPEACDPLQGASAEFCDGLDNDCDGVTDEDLGALTCGVGACRTSVAACSGGTVGQCVPLAPSGEVCGDGIDNDCDGATDEGCSAGAGKICQTDPNSPACVNASKAAERRASK